MSSLQEASIKNQSALFTLAAGQIVTPRVAPNMGSSQRQGAKFQKYGAVPVTRKATINMSASSGPSGDVSGQRIDSSQTTSSSANILNNVGEKFSMIADQLAPQASNQQYMQLAGAGNINMDSNIAQNYMMFKQMQNNKPSFGMGVTNSRSSVAMNASIALQGAGAQSDDESFLSQIWNKITANDPVVEAKEVPQTLDLPTILEARSTDMADMLKERPQETAKIPNELEGGKPPINLFKPKDPLTTKVIFNDLLTKEGAGDVNHIAFDHEGKMPYAEGQSIGVLAKGVDKNGKPHKMRLYSIASSAPGDYGDGKTVSLCVKRLIYDDPETGEEVKGVCSNYICDLKAGDEVEITGPVGTALLLPKDPEATVIMLATGTGIAPFRSYLWRFFLEQHPDYKFNGKAWLFLGVPTTSALLYDDEFKKMKDLAGDKFQYDYAISREATDANGNKMYIQNKMAEYGEELWELMQKPNTYVYMCGLKGMETGIKEALGDIATKNGIEWADFVKGLKKDGRYHVEVY